MAVWVVGSGSRGVRATRVDADRARARGARSIAETFKVSRLRPTISLGVRMALDPGRDERADRRPRGVPAHVVRRRATSGRRREGDGSRLRPCAHRGRRRDDSLRGGACRARRSDERRAKRASAFDPSRWGPQLGHRGRRRADASLGDRPDTQRRMVSADPGGPDRCAGIDRGRARADHNRASAAPRTRRAESDRLHTRSGPRNVAWEASTLAIVGIVFGVPAGVVVGRLAWSLVTHNLGAATTVALPALALVVPATLLLVNAVAYFPARTAARTRPSATLAVE
jgi:hypothetical protein